MRQFNHPNILSIYTSFVLNFDLYVVSKICCYGSCRDTMNNYFLTGFPEIIVCLILKDVLQAIDYLHKKLYIHRAIRASHFLLNERKVMLTGFRDCISVLVHGKKAMNLHILPTNSKGLNWLAPEVLEQNILGYTEKSDVYSLGITTCELANGVEPFSNMPKTLMFTEKVRGNQPSLLDTSTCPSEEVIAQALDSGVGDSFATQTRQIYSQRNLSDPFHKFAEQCMMRDPNERPNIGQLIHHPFFKQARHTTLEEQLLHHGIHPVDFNTIQDEMEPNLMGAFADMQVDAGDAVEWDFDGE
jgi:STE20-related kinase adapter protein alpha